MLPGIQGRWEWMAPADRCAGRVLPRHHVLALRRADERFFRGSVARRRELPRLRSRPSSIAWVSTDVVLMGVSYAGPIAMEFAVRHPDRVRALLLVSALPPDWQPDRRARFYLRAPRLLSPMFLPRCSTAGAARDPGGASDHRAAAALLDWPGHETLSVRFCRRRAWRLGCNGSGEFQFSDPSRVSETDDGRDRRAGARSRGSSRADAPISRRAATCAPRGDSEHRSPRDFDETGGVCRDRPTFLDEILVERPSEEQMMNIDAHPTFAGRSVGTAAVEVTRTSQ